MFNKIINTYGFIVLSCTVILLWLILKALWQRVTSKYAMIYCPSNVPIFGSVLCVKSDSHEIYKQQREFGIKGNHLYMLWMGWMPLIFSEKAEYAKVILGGQANLRKSFTYNFLHEWLNTGLLTSYGEKWKHRRRIITRSFHFSILKEFVPIFEKQAQILVDKFMCAANENKVIDVQAPLSLMALESMCETSLGISNAKNEKAENYVKAIGTLGYEIRTRFFKPWLWPYYIYILTSYGKRFYETLKCVHEYTIHAISRRITIHNEMGYHCDGKVTNKPSTGKRNVSFIDTLIDSYQQGDITIEGIREEVDTFVFEGHDTTSSGITFCLYMLGIYTQYQRALQDEIDKAEGKNVIEIIQNVDFFDCVIKESLRLYPPVSGIGRLMDEDVAIDGQIIYKGTNVIVSIMGLQRNEEYWEDPLIFNPYRFAGNEYLHRNPYCYIPFSAGPRNCIGQKFAMLEIKICLYYVLKNFKFKSLQDKDEIELCTDMITLSQNGVLIKFERR